MKSTEGTAQDAGRRVKGFLTTQAAIIGTAVSAQLLTKFDDTLSQVNAYQLEQDASTAAAKGETANQVVLRSDLYKQFVAPIGEVAKIALRDAAEFSALVVPASAIKRSQFVAKVSSQVDAAAKYEPLFIEHGQPADFVAQIKTAVTQLLASSDARARQLSRKSAATEGLATSVKTMRGLIKVVSGSLTPVLKNNKVLTADWIASKRIRQTPVSPLATAGVVTAGSTTDASQPTESSTPPTATAPIALVQSTPEATKAAA